jgi:predicted MFS family arabinose efflux permease
VAGNSTDTGTSGALWALLAGNFIIGTGVLLPAGLLNQLTAEFGVSAATAGLLLLVGGVVVGVGAPVLAGLTSSIDRRKLLVFALVLYAIGHAASAIVSNFTLLLVLRAITVAGAAIFTPQAAATAGLLVPPERRAAAIAFIFIGWSVSSVAGIPLGSLLGALIGWRFVFAGMAVLCAVAALLVWTQLRPGLTVPPLNFAAWKHALTTPAILCVLGVTLLSMTGQFTVFSYFAPMLLQGFGATAQQISIAFAVVGAAGVLGNTLASRFVSKFGTDLVIAVCLATLSLGLAVFALSFGQYALALVATALWGLGSFSSNSLQQSRLVALAPSLAAATVALNTSVVYLGQALGAGVGGTPVDGGAPIIAAWLAVGFALGALGLSLVATRLVAVHKP